MAAIAANATWLIFVITDPPMRLDIPPLDASHPPALWRDSNAQMISAMNLYSPNMRRAKETPRYAAHEYKSG